jgi:hypothetical protein
MMDGWIGGVGAVNISSDTLFWLLRGLESCGLCILLPGHVPTALILEAEQRTF